MIKTHLNLLAALLIGGAVLCCGQNAPRPNREQEAKLIAVLKSEATQKEKADACRELARIGSKEAVAPLAALLGDEKLSHMARYGLETIPDPAVDNALRAALETLKGRPLVGVIGSIGVRRDVMAVKPLAKFLADTDPDVAQAAARSLGKIGSVAAAKAIRTALSNTPAANQLAFCEGLFRCAEALLAQGQRDEAISIYDQLRGMAGPHQVRAGALRGAILARQKERVPLLLEGIRSADFVLVDAAARTALEMPDADVTAALAAELSRVPADKQVLIIQVLGKRGDPAALPALITAAGKAEKPVRLAAIRALPEIPRASTAPFLQGLMAEADREISQAAQDSLAGLPGPEVDQIVLTMLANADAAKRLTAVDLIGRRRMTPAIPALMKATGDADAKVRPASFKRLGELAGPGEVPALLELLANPKNASDLNATEQAMISVCARVNDPAACTAKIIGMLAQAQPEPKGAMLRVLSTLGDAQALKAVCAAVADPHADVHAAAIRALGTWKTADAAPELLALAQKAANPTDKMLCLRGFMDWASNPEVSANQRLAMCQQAGNLAQSDEEKRLLLGALGGIGTAESLSLTVPYLGDAAVKDEASAAVVAIAQKVLRQNPNAQTAAKLVAPLQKTIAANANADVAQRANDLLKQAQAKAGQ